MSYWSKADRESAGRLAQQEAELEEKKENKMSDKNTVYVGNKQEGAVKIEKENEEYKVYPLKNVYWGEVVSKDPMKSSKKEYAFEWSDTPKETYTYKPYEEQDVTRNPDTLVDFIDKYAHFKLSYTDNIKRKKKKLKEVV